MTATTSEPAMVVRLPQRISARSQQVTEGQGSRRHEHRELRHSTRCQDLLGECSDPANGQTSDSCVITERKRTHQTAFADTITSHPKKPAVRIDTFLSVLLKTSLAVGLLFLNSLSDLRNARM
jgi:hypothetical protein